MSLPLRPPVNGGVRAHVGVSVHVGVGVGMCSLGAVKYIHLNHGDDGVKRLFRRAYALLKPGGRFVGAVCQIFPGCAHWRSREWWDLYGCLVAR